MNVIMRGVIEKMNGGGERGCVFSGEGRFLFSFKNKLDEAFVLGADKKKVKRKCPEHGISSFYCAHNFPESCLIFFEFSDILSNREILKGMLRVLSCRIADILESNAEITFGASVQDNDVH